MNVGLGLGSRGAEVQRLHRVLRVDGYEVSKAETESSEFGQSTLEKLHAFQLKHNLSLTDFIDRFTLDILIVIEKGIVVERGGDLDGPTDPVRPGDRGEVTGTLVNGDGLPVGNTSVTLFAKQLRADDKLKDGRTDFEGAYSLTYRRRGSVNLLVRAYDEAGRQIAQSDVAFAAPANLTLDFTTAGDGVVRSPSRFTLVHRDVIAALNKIPLESLQENKDEHDLRFIASSIDASFNDVASLYIARKLSILNGLSASTLFGLFVQGIPTTLTGALANLPDAGIDATFLAQVMANVLNVPRAQLAKALAAALAGNVLPASYSTSVDRQLSLLDTLRRQSVASAPYLRGKTPLSDLLAAGGTSEAVSTAFVQAYSDAAGNLTVTWTTLQADKTLAAADLTALQTTLNAGELLSGNLALVKDTLQRLQTGSAASIASLATLDQAAWVARITQLDPEATSIPPVLPNETPADRIARFSKALADRFTSRFPAVSFGGSLLRAQKSSFSAGKELGAMLAGQPAFDFKRTNIERFLVEHNIKLSRAALTDLKTAQRLHRLSPHYATVEALKSANFTSARSVYAVGRQGFLAKMTERLGSPALANAAFSRAEVTYATALATYTTFSLSTNGTQIAAFESNVPDTAALANLPTLQALFGSLDFCECSDCRSIVSPAAYLVDLLQFLGQRVQSGLFASARDALFARRPDIQFLALNCNNTNTTLPYIDVANEIFEASIVPPTPPVAIIDTTGASAERRALPQSLSSAAYGLTGLVSFPLSLPFDLAFLQTTAYVAALGTSRSGLLALFRGSPVGTLEIEMACCALGISPAMRKVMTGAGGGNNWDRWGLPQNPASVIDPKTRQPYSPTPADWVASLSKVPVLLDRADLTLAQLYQLLEVRWVTAGGVMLQLGVTTTNGVQLESCDTDLMTFTGLTGDVLDRANRFLRLWKASGLTMWELDWAFYDAAGAAIDDAFLVFLSGALAVSAQLGVAFQNVLSFWGPMGTRDVTNHLGDQDVLAKSTYSTMFLNPTIQAAWGAGSATPVFVDSAALSAGPITFAPPAVPTAAQSANVNAITAALGLSADDVSAILAATGANNALQLATLNVLLKYARLVSSVGASVDELLLWIQLTAQAPFGTSPNATLEFLRRLAVLRATGLSVRDLDYLLRHQSVSRTALAFTPAQALALLQVVRDGIAKLSPLDPTVVQTLFIQSLVSVTGVSAAVVAPVLQKTGVLPLASATVGQLLAQTTVDPTQFPALIAAFTAVAKSAAVFNALRPTEAEFVFLTENAAAFNWLDPGLLPVTASTSSPYPAFEALLRAIRLNRRQAALTPKLFDVLESWTNTLPTTVGAAISSDFAFALNSNVADVTVIAAALNATTPSLTAAAQPGSLADVAMLTLVANALDVVARYSMSGTTLVQLASVPADSNAAATAAGVFQAQYAADQWLAAAQVVEDKLRQSRRDALVAYILGNGAATITGATNTAPISISTCAPHGLQSGMTVTVNGVAGNTAANGTFTVTVTGPTTFTLNGSAGNASWTRGGTIGVAQTSLPIAAATNATPIEVTVGSAHGLQTGEEVTIAGVQGNTAANGSFDVTVTGTTTFSLDGSVGNGAWTSGGTVSLPIAGYLQTVDDVFDWYLIDPEMCSCALTTRLLQGSLTIQQFVQQCFLNLVPQVRTDVTWDEWSWMRQFRLWQANRQVFLYPENYLLPELRTDKSPFFSDLENDLRQGDCDADAAEAALENYLRQLVDASRLVVGAHYHETKPDGSHVLHVFGHTRGTPPKWFYRTRTEPSPGNGVWGAWEPVNLDIATDQLMPTIWDQRLYLIWPTFTQLTEKPIKQPIPPTGSTSSSPPAHTFWSVGFAMSDFRAGQWQPKKTLAEKMYFDVQDPPIAFTFKAYQDPWYNLQIDAYYTALTEPLVQVGVFHPFEDSRVNAVRLKATGSANYVVPLTVTNNWVGNGTLSMPDVPLVVTEADGYLLPYSSTPTPILPLSTLVDLSHEPSFALINTSSGDISLLTPASYSFCAQDLVYGNYQTANPGSVVLNVLSSTSPHGLPSPLPLLGAIVNPRVVVPQQEPNFDSDDPFFVADSTRTYFVEPLHYAAANPQQPLITLGSGATWSTQFVFSPFYHPYATTFQRELEIGGVDQLMLRDLQLSPQSKSGWSAMLAGDFQSQYKPTANVVAPFPVEEVDFVRSGAYAQYNWELFYHAPMFVASLLMQNAQYHDAMDWLKYIFDPTDSSNGTVPQRYWQTKPFNQMNSQSWLDQQIEQILAAPANTSTGAIDAAAIADWLEHPYDPHRVAALRPAAYAKAAVMKFLDNVIAWGDSLYSQYTMEMVGQAEQLYVLASLILGPKPEQVRLSNQNQPSNPDVTTYAVLQAALTNATFADPLVEVENLIVAPALPLQPSSAATAPATMPQITVGTASALYFCIPPNEQLLAYWDTVENRLSNIRHCLNMQGVAQPLPLYAPPINPLQLIEQQAGGADAVGLQPFTPIYRFATYLQKALELASDVRSYGALVLAALEKKDSEGLALLRSNQDLDVQTRMLDIKNLQVTEAQDQITALQNQRKMVQVRQDFYSRVEFMNQWETAAMALQGQALVLNKVSVILDLTASFAHLIPSFSGGVEGFGGSPEVTISFGGENYAGAASAWAGISRTLASILSETSGMTSTLGGYHRRQDDWTLQLNLANAELVQIDSQIAVANDRANIAASEQALQTQQIANAQAVSDFLTNKYTNSQLYEWLVTQLTSVHTQAYQLALTLARQAESAYRFELGSSSSFIQSGYWDGQHRGLTAGDSLLFDLRRMESQYLIDNLVEQDVTRSVSLALSLPQSLATLLQTGTCTFSLDEALFDADHPGHYFRRLRRVGVSIPCVTGPYTGVNATLILNSAVIRLQPPTSPYVPATSTTTGTNFQSWTNSTGAMITISTGQDDAGQFDSSLRGQERFLPFEGLGAVSTWTLVLDPRDNAIDLSTVTDVVIHLSYTSRVNIGTAELVRTALKPLNARSILVFLKHTFSAAYNRFFNPTDATSSAQTLTLPFPTSMFPFANTGAPFMTGLTLYVVTSSAPAAGTSIPASFGPAGSTKVAIKLTAVTPQTTASGGAIAALSAQIPWSAATAPQPYELSILAADIPPTFAMTVGGQQRLNAAMIEDIVLLVSYKLN